MKKIEKLTKQQEVRLQEFHQEWLAIGLSCEPADWESAENAISEMYALIGKDKPRFFRMTSPWQNEVAKIILDSKNDLSQQNLRQNLGENLRQNLEQNLGENLRQNLWQNLEQNLRQNLGENLRQNLRQNLGENLRQNLWQNLDRNFYGQHSAFWIAFYKFCQEIGVPYDEQDLKILDLWAQIAKSCCWWSPYERICFISDRPSFIKKDDSGRLHCETGAAFEFRDGWNGYFWHGISIPTEWIKDKSNLTPEVALTWKNAEQRRCACEILGWTNVLEHPSLNPKIIDQDEPHIGTLIEVDLPDAPKQRFIKFQCGTGRWFAEAVNDKEFDTALKANAAGNGWRPGFGDDPDNYIPFART